MGTTRDGEPLVNVVVEEGKGARLLRKRTGESLPLKPPARRLHRGQGPREALLRELPHAPGRRAASPATRTFDPKDEGFDHAAQKWVQGTWNETAGPFEATLPTLGVLARRRRRAARSTPSCPGMIMTFDRNKEAGKPPDILFRRLYAKLFAHTIRREARSCESCHNDPVALGFGKGTLRYAVVGHSRPLEVHAGGEALAARRPARGRVDRVPEGARPAWSRRARARGRSPSTSSAASSRSAPASPATPAIRR